MKLLRSVLILAYGALITIGAMVAIGFGNAYSGWGDGATSSHPTSASAAWPAALFFVVSAAAPFAERRMRVPLFFAATFLLFVGFAAGLRGEDRFFIPLCVLILSLVVWLPLFAPHRAMPSQVESTL